MINNPICEECDHPQTFCACCAEGWRFDLEEARYQWAKDDEVLEMLN